MKKILLFTLFISVTVFSCKKNQSAVNPAKKKYKVTFNVTNFTQSQKAFAIRHNAIGLASSDTLTALNGYFDVLYYALLYDHQDYEHPPVMQDSTTSNMGIFTDSIPAGSYQIAFFAGKKGLTYSSYFSPTAFYGYGGAPWQDTFWNAVTFTVSAGDQKITQNITLIRVVGKLEVKLLDKIPATADSLFITTHYESQGKWMNDNDDYSIPSQVITFPVAIPASAKGQPNFTVDRIIGNTTDAMSVTITCKDINGNIIANTTANNVQFHQNQKTILSGNLFEASGGETFTAKIDTAWGTTQHSNFP